MCNIFFHSDDNMFQQGMVTLLNRVLSSQCKASKILFDTLTENNVSVADIIVMNFSKGEEKICHKMLQSRKSDCLLIGFYRGDHVISTGDLPLCLNKSIFIKRNESIEDIAKKILQLWSTRLSITSLTNKRTCFHCQHATLSAQQIRFVNYFSSGLDTNEITYKMNINAKTVSAHKRQVMLKFNVKNDCELLNILRCIKNKSCVSVLLSDYLLSDFL